MRERWTASKEGDGYYHFIVKRAPPGVGLYIFCALTAIFWGVSIIALIIVLIVRSKKDRFSVSAEGFKVGDKSYSMNKINSWGVTNPNGNMIYNLSSFSQAVNAESATISYCFSLQVGGGYVHLAKGLKAVQAEGLMADVQRAIDGVL